ncbi:MAG: hypothetical protein Fur0028_03990 [Bacteroidales bacterium]
MKHKFISIFFISIFLFSFFAVSFHFIILQVIVKTEIQKAIKHKSIALNDIKVFKYNEIKNNIYWHEKNKEFSYNHKMYDILNVSKINNSLYIYALEDTKEEAIIIDFLKKSSHIKHILLLQNFLQLFIFDLIDSSNVFFNFTKDSFIIKTSNLYKNINTEIHTPPPKLVCTC